MTLKLTQLFQGRPEYVLIPPVSFSLIIKSLFALLFLLSTNAHSNPNLIVFLLDDLGWADLSCQGSQDHENPNLDELAASGIHFTNSYSANPVCSPTRAALLAGKAPSASASPSESPSPRLFTFLRRKPPSPKPSNPPDTKPDTSANSTPIQAPKELVKKYEEKKLYGNSGAEKIFHRYQTTSRPRQDHTTYAAMMENLNTNIGRVIDKLDELKLTENTIILFTSDNGGHCHLKKSPDVTCSLSQVRQRMDLQKRHSHPHHRFLERQTLRSQHHPRRNDRPREKAS